MGGCLWLVAAAAVLAVCEARVEVPPSPQGRFPDLPIAVRGSNNPLCAKHSAMLEEAIANNTLWGARMWESSAHVPNGWTYGLNFQLGDFDGCFETGAPFQEQYCLARIHITPEALAARQIDSAAQPMHWGVCVPASCSPADVARSLDTALPKGMSTEVLPRDCSQSTDADGSQMFRVILIVVLGAIAALLIAASLADYQRDPKETGTPGLGQSLLLCFSVPRNWKELWTLDEVSPYRMPLHAFDSYKIFTSFFVVFCHYFELQLRLPVTNPMQFKRIIKEQRYPLFTEAQAYVYTMFIVGGLLTSIVHLNSRRNPVKSILERYLRFLPIVVLTLLTAHSIFALISFGPIAGFPRERIEICNTNWWADALLVSNYKVHGDLCLPHFWYLSADMHLFILSVVVLLPLLRYRRSLGTAVAVLLSTASVLLSFYLNYTKGWPHFHDISHTFVRRPDAMLIVMERMGATHHNVPAYLIGLCVGAWLVDNHKSADPYKLTKKADRALRLLGFMLCIATMYVGSLMQAGYGTQLEKSLYFALHRITFCSGAAIIFAAMMLRPGGGQTLTKKVLARLSFSVYALHVPVIFAYEVYQRQYIYLNFSSAIVQTIGLFAVMYAMGLVVHIALEMPLNNIRGVLLKKRKVD